MPIRTLAFLLVCFVGLFDFFSYTGLVKSDQSYQGIGIVYTTRCG